MQHHKHLNELSEEELLKALESSSDVSTVEPTLPAKNTDYVSVFIHNFGLKPGNYKVKTNLLWQLFKEAYPNTLKKGVFLNRLALHFEIKQGSMYFDQDSITLSRKAMQLLAETSQRPAVKAKDQKIRVRFLKFTQEYKLVKGDYFVPGAFLFNLYDEYTYNHKQSFTFSAKTFDYLCQIYFERKLTKDGNYYGVNNEQKETHCKEERWKAYEEVRKKKQKKPRKVSNSTTGHESKD